MLMNFVYHVKEFEFCLENAEYLLKGFVIENKKYRISSFERLGLMMTSKENELEVILAPRYK